MGTAVAKYADARRNGSGGHEFWSELREDIAKLLKLVSDQLGAFRVGIAENCKMIGIYEKPFG